MQEIIIQPFRPKEATRMAQDEACPESELLWAVAAAKLILGPCSLLEPQLLEPRTHASLGAKVPGIFYAPRPPSAFSPGFPFAPIVALCHPNQSQRSPFDV